MVEAAVAKCQAAAVELAAVANKEEQSKGKGPRGLEASKEMTSAAENLAAAAYEVAAAKRLLHDITRALAEAATANAAASSQALVDLLDKDEDYDDDDDDFPISDEVAAATALASDAIVTMASTQALAFAAGKEAVAALSFAGAAATFAASPTDFRAFTWDVDLDEEMIKEEGKSEDNMSVPLKAWNLSEAAEEVAVNALDALDGAAHRAHRILAKVLRHPPPGPVLRRGDKNQKPPKDGAIGHKMLMTGKAGVEAAKSLHRAALLIQRQMAKEGYVLSLEHALRIITSPPDIYPPFVPSPELPPELAYPHVIIPTPPTVTLPPRVLLPEEFKIPEVPPKIPEVPPSEKKSFDWLKLVKRTLGTARAKTGLEQALKDYKPDWKAFGKPSVDETPEPPEDLY